MTDRIAQLEADVARATRAQAAFDEFLAPMFSELQNVYSERLVEVANTELSRDKRADKITALSHALKVVSTLEKGMEEIIRNGEAAHRELLRVDRIENMTAPAKRLLGIVPV